VANLLVGSCVLIFFFYFLRWMKKYFGKIKPETGLFLLWFVIPILAPTLISFWKPIYFYRYLVFLSVPLSFLIFSGLTQIKTQAIGFGLIILSSLLSYQVLSRQSHTMREALTPIYSDSRRAETIYTFLPSFAEVAYYNRGRFRLIVSSEGLVQFSGKSLLDALVAKGQASIGVPPAGSYWQVEPGPKVSFH